MTNETSPDSGFLAASPPPDKRTRPSSLYDGAMSEPADDLDEFLPLTPLPRTLTTRSETTVSYVTETLERESFTEDSLVCHLSSLGESNPATAMVLGDVWKNRSETSKSSILDSFETVEDGYINDTYEFYEVCRDGMPEPLHRNLEDQDGEVWGPLAVWETLKDVNVSRNAVGRMT